MSVTETSRSGRLILECDECPNKPDYEADLERNRSDLLPEGADWSKSCRHIEAHILQFEDAGTLAPESGYHLNLSPTSAWLTRDCWNSWVIITLGEKTASGLAPVSYRYESEFYTESSGFIGKISPDDGRQSIRNMLWDSITSVLFERQPDVEKKGIRCPVRSHTDGEEKRMRLTCSTQDGINAQVASIVFENCCTFCYRKTMGQDANFGMAEAVPPPRQQRSSFGRQIQTGVPSSSTTNPAAPSQPSGASTTASSGSVPKNNSVAATTRKAGQSMSEYLKDPNLPF